MKILVLTSCSFLMNINIQQVTEYLIFAILFLQLPKRKCYVAQHASKFGNYYHTYIFNSQLFLWNATNIMNSHHYGWRSNQSRGMWYLFANKSKLKYLKMRKFSFSSMATESYPIIQCMCKTYFIIFIIIFTHFSYLFMWNCVPIYFYLLFHAFHGG